jgi:DNA-binding MarR family transcriptional regulator
VGILEYSKQAFITFNLFERQKILTMSSRLQHELQQSRPFSTPAEEASLALLRTASRLDRLLLQKLRPYKLTPPQYNLLRILRGAGSKGLACGQLSDRMISLDPDVTRLLDRLEKRGLISRQRGQKDRRVVTTKITDEGAKLIAPIDDVVDGLHVQIFQNTRTEDTRHLIDVLASLRSFIDTQMNDAE